MDTFTRCFGDKPGEEIYKKYHDEEWCIPKYDDREIFELLCLEGAQAGLSWLTILRKREGYRKAFKNFDVDLVSKMTDDELLKLLTNNEIIKNKLKIFSIRNNAIVFKQLQKENKTFSNYIWNFTNKEQIKSSYLTFKEVPASSVLSETISKELKKKGMKFVGPVIIYSFLQSIGILDDHILSCHCRKK